MRILRFTLACLAFSTPSLVHAADPAPKAGGTIAAMDACTPSERWVWNSKIPAAWQRQFSRVEIGREAAVRTYAWAGVLRSTAKTDEARQLGEHFQAKAYAALGLKTFAYRLWNELLAREATSPDEIGIRRAAWDCALELHRESSAFSVTPAMMQFAIRQSTQSEGQSAWLARPQIHRAALDFIRRRLAEAPEGEALDFTAELSLLKGAGARESAALALIAARDEKDSEALAHASRALEGGKAAESPLSPELADQLRMLVARSHYHLGRFADAARAYDAIVPPSNSFAQALAEKSWAQLNAGRYAEASSAAHNLLIGKLRSVFAPEPATTIAIALFENCRYPEALKTVRLFKRFYQPTYAWLYQWRKSGASGSGLYTEAKSFLARKSKVPDPVGTEWLRSPLFLSYQHAINGLIDERTATKSLLAYLARTQASVKDKSMLKARTALRQSLERYPQQLAQVEAASVRRIEADFAARNEQMLRLVVDAAENAQLIEAEIFNAAGEDMILANVEKASGKRAATRKPAMKPREAEGGQLDWGKLPKDSVEKGGESVEIWEDELGALWADMHSRCRGK